MFVHVGDDVDNKTCDNAIWGDVEGGGGRGPL